MKAQGFDLKKNAYNNPFQPYVAYWDLNIPIFAGLYIGYKVYKGTKIWKPEEMDFVTGIPTLEETEIPEPPPKNGWEKFVNWLF
ncbi:hypothetical protein H0H81_002985 [Sphagnurus paluster]|uniref:Uncharacterized protein n=1 Tax=Sphagnurus paluster TaxID=117069 RepID=A0A9P7FWZ1_9AGAR|nr:hypothetical protein H0H81_002985 [Sphagnurus paluster]